MVVGWCTIENSIGNDVLGWLGVSTASWLASFQADVTAGASTFCDVGDIGDDVKNNFD